MTGSLSLRAKAGNKKKKISLGNPADGGAPHASRRPGLSQRAGGPLKRLASAPREPLLGMLRGVLGPPGAGVGVGVERG